MSNEIEWDFSQLPYRHEEPPSKFCGSCMIVFGAFLGGPLTWIFIKSIFAGSFEAAMLVLLPFLVIGIGLFLAGLRGVSTRTVTEFDGKTFRYRQTSIFPCFRKAWDEPLSGYEGVLARTEYHSNSDDSYTLYIIELLHPDEQRRIKLWQRRKYSWLGVSRKECRRQHHANWKKYCRQLGLPALKQDWGEDIGEYTRRAPDDLDKSVCQLRAEGRLEINFYPAAAVPERLKLNVRGDQLEVEICRPWMLRCVMLSLFVFPVTFICAGFDGNIVSVILGIFIGVLIVRVYKRWKYEEWLSSTCLVRINRKGLHILDRPPRGVTKERHICADAIRKVRVGKASPEQNFSSVVVETDTSSYAIGEGLDMGALEWLKNCILSKIAIGQEFT